MTWWTRLRGRRRHQGSAFRADFEAISVAFKRIKNILRQATENGNEHCRAFDAAADGQREVRKKRWQN